MPSTPSGPTALPLSKFDPGEFIEPLGSNPATLIIPQNTYFTGALSIPDTFNMAGVAGLLRAIALRPCGTNGKAVVLIRAAN